nr:MAG TPA: hypothetical protein [Bacteriophage sp.]
MHFFTASRFFIAFSSAVISGICSILLFLFSLL